MSYSRRKQVGGRGSVDRSRPSRVNRPMFACTFVDCTKLFTRRSNRKRHYGTHMNYTERPKFQCVYCDAQYTRLGTLTHHCKTIHGEIVSMLPVVDTMVHEAVRVDEEKIVLVETSENEQEE